MKTNLDSIQKQEYIQKGSARDWCKPGIIYQTKNNVCEIIKAFIMPVNKCPHCKSKNTYHATVGNNNNVWKFEESYLNIFTTLSKKWDFCFKCHKEFLIEAYLMVKIPKKEYKRQWKKDECPKSKPEGHYFYVIKRS